MRLVAAALAAAALVACTGSGTDPNPPSSASAEAMQEFAGGGAPLEAGPTRYSAFEPAFTFVLPEGWSGGHEHADYFDVWRGGDLAVGFGRPTGIPGPDGRVAADSVTPRGALRAVARLVEDPSPISETEIDGRSAVEMTFSVDRHTGVLAFEGGVLHLDPPWRQRAIALEVDGDLVIVLVQTTERGAGALDTSIPSTIEFDA